MDNISKSHIERKCISLGSLSGRWLVHRKIELSFDKSCDKEGSFYIFGMTILHGEFIERSTHEVLIEFLFYNNNLWHNLEANG